MRIINVAIVCVLAFACIPVWAGTTTINFSSNVGLLTHQSGAGLVSSGGRAHFNGATTAVLEENNVPIAATGFVRVSMSLTPYSDAQNGVGLVLADAYSGTMLSAIVDGDGYVSVAGMTLSWFDWPAASNTLTIEYDTYSDTAWIYLNSDDPVTFYDALEGASSYYVGVGSTGSGGFSSFTATGNSIPTYPYVIPNVVTPNPSGAIQEGASVALSAPTGSGYQWKRNGANLSADAHRTGVTGKTMNINPVAPTDAGSYTCVYTTSAKTIKETDPYTLVVNALPNTITANPSAFTEEGIRLTLTAPAGSNYQWKRNGVNLANDPHRTGVTSQTLILDPISASDDGAYTCAYTNTASAARVTDEYDLVAYPIGVVPVASFASILLLVGAVMGGGVAAMGHTRRRMSA